MGKFHALHGGLVTTNLLRDHYHRPAWHGWLLVGGLFSAFMIFTWFHHLSSQKGPICTEQGEMIPCPAEWLRQK